MNKFHLFLSSLFPFSLFPPTFFFLCFPPFSLFLTLDWVINHSVQFKKLGAHSHGLCDLEIVATFFSTWLALWQSSFTSALWGQSLSFRHTLAVLFNQIHWKKNLTVHMHTLDEYFMRSSLKCWIMSPEEFHNRKCWNTKYSHQTMNS